MEIGRNDKCLCGSGKKYKKCCLGLKKNSNDLWKENCLKLNDDIEQKEDLTEIFYSTYDFMMKNNWQGACHAISSIQYILLSELGLSPNLCIGVVSTDDKRFDHSWVELNNKVYDTTIENGLEGECTKAVIASKYINTLESVNGIYGIGEELDFPANKIQELNITEYLEGFTNQPKSEIPYYLNSGLWNLIIELGSKVNLNLNEEDLKIKYSKVKRIVK